MLERPAQGSTPKVIFMRISRDYHVMHILVMELIDCLDVAKDDFLLSFESLGEIRFMHLLQVALHEKGGK